MRLAFFSKPFSPALLRRLLGYQGPRLGTGTHTCFSPQSTPAQGPQLRQVAKSTHFLPSQTDLSDQLTYFSLLNLIFFLGCTKHSKFSLARNPKCHRKVDASSAGKFLLLPKLVSLLRERFPDHLLYNGLPSLCLTLFSSYRRDVLVLKNLVFP